MNVLVIKANNRPDGISTRMYETFMDTIKDAKNLEVVNYDLFNEDMPYLGQELFDAFGKLQAGVELNDYEKRLLTAKQKAKDLTSAADVIVLAFPLWNLTPPARLHTYIDYIAEAGFAFKYSPEGDLIQMLEGKKAIVLCAKGGIYSTPERAAMDMTVSYIKNLFAGMFGIDIIEEVIIEGHNAFPDKAEEILEKGLQEVKAAALRLTESN